jgi:hypothetical protein
MTTLVDLPIIALVVALLLLGIAAVGWGVDSRPTIADDYRR